MSLKFTYDGDLSKLLNRVRFEVGDTNAARPLLSDTEIEGVLVIENNDPLLAAAHCCDALEAKFSSIPNFKVGQISKDFGDIAAMFGKKAAQIRQRSCLMVAPSAPAIEVASKEALATDTTLTKPQFSVGQYDNPFASQLNQTLNDRAWGGW